MPGPVVDVLEVVAVEDDEAQLASMLLGATELALQQILEPAPVVEARERVGVRAAALAVERHRRVERCRCVRGEERCQLTLAAVELPREAAGTNQQADLLTVRPQRNQHHRPELQAGELGHRHRSRVEQLEHCRCVDPRAQRPQRVQRQRLGTLGRRAPLRRLDELPVLVEQQQLARLDRQHPAERAHRHLRDRLRVAERAHVDEEASERREIRAGAAQLVHGRGQDCEELRDRAIAARRKRYARLDVEDADDPGRHHERR